MRGGIPRLKDTVSGPGDKLRHLWRGETVGHRGATGGGVSWSVPWALPWRKRVGIEPTIPGTNPESTDLKSAKAARPHALPTERARLSRPVERDLGGADGDRTRDLVNAIHARSQLRHSPNSGCLDPAEFTAPRGRRFWATARAGSRRMAVDASALFPFLPSMGLQNWTEMGSETGHFLGSGGAGGGCEVGDSARRGGGAGQRGCRGQSERRERSSATTALSASRGGDECQKSRVWDGLFEIEGCSPLGDCME